MNEREVNRLYLTCHSLLTEKPLYSMLQETYWHAVLNGPYEPDHSRGEERT